MGAWVPGTWGGGRAGRPAGGMAGRLNPRMSTTGPRHAEMTEGRRAGRPVGIKRAKTVPPRRGPRDPGGHRRGGKIADSAWRSLQFAPGGPAPCPGDYPGAETGPGQRVECGQAPDLGPPRAFHVCIGTIPNDVGIERALAVRRRRCATVATKLGLGPFEHPDRVEPVEECLCTGIVGL